MVSMPSFHQILICVLSRKQGFSMICSLFAQYLSRYIAEIVRHCTIFGLREPHKRFDQISANLTKIKDFQPNSSALLTTNRKSATKTVLIICKRGHIYSHCALQSGVKMPAPDHLLAQESTHLHISFLLTYTTDLVGLIKSGGNDSAGPPSRQRQTRSI